MPHATQSPQPQSKRAAYRHGQPPLPRDDVSGVENQEPVHHLWLLGKVLDHSDVVFMNAIVARGDVFGGVVDHPMDVTVLVIAVGRTVMFNPASSNMVLERCAPRGLATDGEEISRPFERG